MPTIMLLKLKKTHEKIPKDRWSKTHHQLVLFGRYHCKAINPNCTNCKLYDICIEKRKLVLKVNPK